MTGIRISAPKTASKGEVIELKALIKHPMESGFRPDARGNRIPRDIIAKFTCTYNGETVFEAEFHPGVAANPFLSFHTRANQSGRLTFTWTDQDGQIWSDTREITVK